MTRSVGRLRSYRLAFLGGAVLTLLALPGVVLGATGPEPSPPPCSIDHSTVVAGTPLQMSGTVAPPDGSVGVSFYRDKNDIRQASVATLNDGTWRAVILFGAADAGSWTVEVDAEGARCSSSFAVTLPAGIVAPPTAPPVAPNKLDPPPESDVQASTIRETGAKGALVLFVGSWIFLALVALVSLVSRARPLRHRSVRTVARIAAFTGVLGGFVSMGLVAYFADAVRYFDVRIPEVEMAMLDTAIWCLAIVGSIVGTLAALRVGDGATAEAA